MNITPTLKKYVMPNLPYLMFFWFFAEPATAFRLVPGISKFLSKDYGEENSTDYILDRIKFEKPITKAVEGLSDIASMSVYKKLNDMVYVYSSNTIADGGGYSRMYFLLKNDGLLFRDE